MMDVTPVSQGQTLGQRASLFMLIALLVLFFFPTFVGLSSEWTKWDESLSHAYPLLVWFLVLLFRVGPIAPEAQSRWLDVLFAVALVGASISWFLFHAIQIKILEQLLLLPLLFLSVGFVFGLKRLWQLRFLLVMPLFVLPIWDYLNASLVELASYVVGELVRLVRIPALIDGSSIFIPSGHIMIADGCSGLRYLIISLALGYNISYLNGYREKGLFFALIIAALLGLMANWIRIFVLILVGYHTDMQSSLMEDHEAFGWLIFAAICFPAIYFSPVIKKNQRNLFVGERSISLSKLFSLVVLLAPGLLLTKIVSHNATTEIPPISLGGKPFVSSAYLPMPLQLPAATSKQQFVIDGTLYLQVNRYIPTSSKERLVPYIARQYDSQLWLQETSKVISAGERKVRVDQLRQKSGLKRIVMVQWFNVGGREAPSVAQAKLLQIPAVLSGQQYFTVFTLQAECNQSRCENSLRSLIELSESIQ